MPSYKMTAGGMCSTYGLKNIITKNIKLKKIEKPKLETLNEPIKVCEYCNKPLTGKKQKYCSTYCTKQIFNKIILQVSHDVKYNHTTKQWCKNCLKTLPIINKHTKYCSNKCRYEFNKNKVIKT